MNPRSIFVAAMLAIACGDTAAERAQRAQEATARAANLQARVNAEREALCTKERARTADKLMQALVRRWQIEIDMAAVWVDPELWPDVSLDGRTGFGKWISLCLRPEEFPAQLKWVSWRHPNTGTEFGIWSSLDNPSSPGSYRSGNE